MRALMFCCVVVVVTATQGCRSDDITSSPVPLPTSDAVALVSSTEGVPASVAGTAEKAPPPISEQGYTFSLLRPVRKKFRGGRSITFQLAVSPPLTKGLMYCGLSYGPGMIFCLDRSGEAQFDFPAGTNLAVFKARVRDDTPPGEYVAICEVLADGFTATVKVPGRKISVVVP